MAWFYNLILVRFFEIGLVAVSQRRYSPAATVVHNFAFFLTNPQIPKFRRLENGQKDHFSMSLKNRPIPGSFACGKKTICLFVPIWGIGHKGHSWPLLPLHVSLLPPS
ncbi:MAG TPA: hypothetical protein VKB26_02685 [Candidatus Acidoferrales bacterium]|nr:hypothetical protein [Candidatus Acidoferrales bacterium]